MPEGKGSQTRYDVGGLVFPRSRVAHRNWKT